MVSITSDQLSPFLTSPKTAGVFLDFDGTLSPIVNDPASAELAQGAGELLRALSRRFKVIGVLSGRPLSFLEPILPASVAICGLYGLEAKRHGVRSDHPSAGAWREVIDDIVTLSTARGPDGMTVESKGLSLTLHYRTHPELADDVADWAAAMAAKSGLMLRAAKMSVELHPPIDTDKGTAVERLAQRLDTVAFVGDDVGDLPAFEALDRLAGDGRTTLRVAVLGPETPRDLSVRADATVEGTDGVLDLLRAFLDGDASSDRRPA